MLNQTLGFILNKPTKQPVLVVVEQKGSDEIECKERILAGYHLAQKLKNGNVLDVRFMVVGGANNGVSPDVIKKWIPETNHFTFLIKNKAANTREKALSMVAYIIQEKVQTVFQVTSLYHSLRAYLTTLHALSEKDIKLRYFYNVVCDTDDISGTDFAIRNEFLLANDFSNGRKKKQLQEVLPLLRSNHGLKKYFDHRYDEAKKIVTYSEKGKGHLITRVNIDDIMKTYIVNG